MVEGKIAILEEALAKAKGAREEVAFHAFSVSTNAKLVQGENERLLHLIQDLAAEVQHFSVLYENLRALTSVTKPPPTATHIFPSHQSHQPSGLSSHSNKGATFGTTSNYPTLLVSNYGLTSGTTLPPNNNPSALTRHLQNQEGNQGSTFGMGLLGGGQNQVSGTVRGAGFGLVGGNGEDKSSFPHQRVEHSAHRPDAWASGPSNNYAGGGALVSSSAARTNRCGGILSFKVEKAVQTSSANEDKVHQELLLEKRLQEQLATKMREYRAATLTQEEAARERHVLNEKRRAEAVERELARKAELEANADSIRRGREMRAMQMVDIESRFPSSFCVISYSESGGPRVRVAEPVQNLRGTWLRIFLV
ncbi:unnamed protein product [Amoebophrya sp. A120]|nr:unnamed protein product [Amoebophrya sp. A120]|eukprot:GSA120T00005397001.1